MLGEIIVDDEDILALIPPVFCPGCCSIGSNIEPRCRFARGSVDNDCIFPSIVGLQFAFNLSNRRILLSDCTIDADDIFSLLVDDGVDGKSGFTGLTITDD